MAALRGMLSTMARAEDTSVMVEIANGKWKLVQ